jgi:endonuclease YncB( thermonuclease family)
MRPGWLVLAGTLSVLALGALAMSAASRPGPTTPSVIDGDTLEVDGRIVQLFGIDAPELGQLCGRDGAWWPCGVEAALALRKHVTFGAHQLGCERWPGAATGTAVAGARHELCRIGHEDLALVMLHGGHATALPDSFPDYREAQEQARQARLGIWHSAFAMPWHWREATGGADRRCNVKGILGPAGGRLYIVPTDPAYRASPAEQLFCSDEEARAAGWHRPPAP